MATNLNARPSFLYKLTHLEPAVYRGIIIAVFGVAASLGVVVSDTIPDQVIVLVLALLPLIQGFWTRTAVVAEDKVVAYVENPLAGTQLKAGPAAPAVGTSKAIVEAAVYQKAA